MPGVLSGLNHSSEIQACGRSRMPRSSSSSWSCVDAVLEPGAFDRDLQVLRRSWSNSSSAKDPREIDAAWGSKT